MKYFIGALVLVSIAGGLFLFLKETNIVMVSAPSPSTLSSAPILETPKIDKGRLMDIEPQKPLTNPPSHIKAVYLTSWSAGSQKKVDYIIDLIKTTELNAVVVDIKDYSGYVAYDIDLPEVKKYKAKEIRIPRLNALIERLHNEKIYVIGRITIFQDPILAEARPDLAIHSRKGGGLWLDHKKLAWIDPDAKEAWDYNIAIAKDAVKRGFDELNFDYIRFASDGNLGDMKFPFWDEKILKEKIINDFFKYLRESLPDVKISADLFGLTTVQSDDLGIGQLIENAYAYFDYVSPMVYPSHYAEGFLNYKNPAKYPYEVVKYSMESAIKRLKSYEYGVMSNEKTTSTIATSMPVETTPFNTQNSLLKTKLRPWLQDFNLGATYDARMVKAQIRAVYDAASSTPELSNGWILWNPSNIYTKEALEEVAAE
ncbi:MAG: putative glycoside hydrolase [Patescibacteria group bacterium]